MRSAVIVEAKRTPIGRGVKGAYAATRPEALGAAVLESLKPLLKDWSALEDVLVGCAMPEGEQGMNMARLISFRAGLPITAGAATINRFCGSSQETMLMAARAIMANQGDLFLAGGVESMSKVPMMGFNPSVDPYLTETYPQAYCSMGITAENLAKEYKISRREQDEFAFGSHQKAAAAWKAGKFEKEIVRFETKGLDGKPVTLLQDECMRADTTVEKLGELKAAFLADGCVTAGNSSPITDGAAFLLVMEEGLAKSLGLKARARIIGGAVAGVEPDRMGIGPVPAVKKVLDRFGLKLDQIDAMELNEAFAAQSLAVIREGGYDPAKVNAWGGAIAVGHPLGASGARILTTLLNRLETDGGKYGIATMCIGGGQGIASIIERFDPQISQIHTDSSGAIVEAKDPQTYAIIGAAMEVHRVLGCGFSEPTYQDALAVELQQRNIPFQREVPLSINYKGQKLNTVFRADFMCFNRVIVELKALARLGPIEDAQLMNYLKVAGVPVGLLLNFGTRSLESKRMVGASNYGPPPESVKSVESVD